MSQCPHCGSEELYVIRAKVYCRAPLTSDGFALWEGKQFDTEDEVVHCDGCDEEFGLDEVVEEDEA